jgi:DNA-binding transcriptional MerR regulator
MKSSRGRPWTIGELAERFDLPTHVLRHWEDMGLLAPARDSAGRRRYVEADLYRVAVILSSKAAGMSLEQVRNLVDGSPRADTPSSPTTSSRSTPGWRNWNGRGC